MRTDFVFESVKQTSIVKKIIQKKFKDKIGFQDHFHKNQSTMAYDNLLVEVILQQQYTLGDEG